MSNDDMAADEACKAQESQSIPIGRAYHPGSVDHPNMARCSVRGCGWWLSPGYPCPEEHAHRLATPDSLNVFGCIDPKSPESHLRSVLWDILGGMGAESVESAAQRVVNERSVARIERDTQRDQARLAWIEVAKRNDTIKELRDVATLALDVVRIHDECEQTTASTPMSVLNQREAARSHAMTKLHAALKRSTLSVGPAK
jgi:hypothetical protein